MKTDKLSIKVELDGALAGKTASEINHFIRMQKVVLFLYKESTIFFLFMPIFMFGFIYNLFKVGVTNHVINGGIIQAIVYFGFYHLIIKRIAPFKNRKQEYKEIKDKLEALIEYRENIV